MPSGRDFRTLPALGGGGANGPISQTQVSLASHASYYEVGSYPMLPSQILICAPKDSYQFTHAPGVGNVAEVFSRDSSLSIKSIEITINTTERQYKFSRDASMFEDQNILVADTIQNCVSGLFEGDFDAFRSRGNFVLLSSDQFCPISMMSPGVVSPVNISVVARLKNVRICGLFMSREKQGIRTR